MQKRMLVWKSSYNGKKRIRIIVYVDLERIMSDWGWGPHHITHQAAKVPLKQRYFPDECRGGGKFTHTFRIHLRGQTLHWSLKCSGLVSASLMGILDLTKKHQFKRSASEPAPPLLTHLAKLAMADFTGQGQTHFWVTIVTERLL